MLKLVMPNLWLLFAISLILSACGGGNEINKPSGSPIARPNIPCDNPIETLPPVIREYKQLIQGQCYLVNEAVRIDPGGYLEIFGNTKIAFELGTSLVVSGGALVAQGTAEQPILFTGRRELSGQWQGIAFHHQGNVSSYLQYAIIEYAGGEKFLALNRASSIALLGTQRNQANGIGQIFITNNLITKNKGHGVAVLPGSPLASFESNVISSSDLAPLYFPANLVQNIDPSNSLNNNQVLEIEINDGEVGLRTAVKTENPDPHVWHNHGNISYKITRDITLNSPLELAPGTKLIFDTDTELSISSTNAYLKAIGKPGQEIVFTGTDPTPGHWVGLDYNDSVHSSNMLDYVKVEYAGASKRGRSTGPQGAAIFLGGAVGSQVSISNSQILYSAGYGFLVDSKSNFKRFARNIVANNNLNPGSVPLPGIEVLSENNSLFGNMDDRIRVFPSAVRSNENIKLKKLGIPYWFEKNLEVSGTMNIEQGVTLQFDRNANIFVNGAQSSLMAKGTLTEPVVFTPSTNSFPFDWPGITFNNSRSTQNLLEHVIVEYGGGPIQGQNTGNIKATNDSSLVLNYALIQYGINYGLWIENSTINQQNGVEIIGNYSGISNQAF